MTADVPAILSSSHGATPASGRPRPGLPLRRMNERSKEERNIFSTRHCVIARTVPQLNRNLPSLFFHINNANGGTESKMTLC